MKELITVQIIRPQLEALSPSDRKVFVENMAKDIAKQIMEFESIRHMAEDRRYWEEKLLEWEIEDTIRRINGK